MLTQNPPTHGTCVPTALPPSKPASMRPLTPGCRAVP